MEKKILYRKTGKVSEIILNNPQKLNCMGFDMLRGLEEAVEKVRRDTGPGAMLIRGSGDRAFSTGADLKEFGALTDEQAVLWIELGNRVFNEIEHLPIPTVAVIRGYAMGGGLELALACDFRLGTPEAVLSSPELQHGWLPGWGGMTRLRRLVGEARAREVVMLGERIDAASALRLGLLTRVLGAETGEKELRSFLEHLTGLDPLAFRLAKQALMDPGRTTGGHDVEFDILAMQACRKKSE